MAIRTLNLPFSGNSIYAVLVSMVVLIGGGWGMFEWTINRIYVDEGYSLLLRYKGKPLPFLPGISKAAEPGEFAKVDKNGSPLELGVLEQLRGPGRHFYCPIWWERTVVKDEVVEPKHVGIATSKMGKPLPKRQFLVDGNLGSTLNKGILRKVFGPGRYRVNTYAYEFKQVELVQVKSGNQIKYAGWVDIPTGYVGVVTNLSDNLATNAKAGIQESVLPPGLYPINGKEQQIDIVEIGYRERSIIANLTIDPEGNLVLDESGEPMLLDDNSGITFPSNDAFQINMDFTAIWGIMPTQAPEVIRKFGNVDAVETKVVIPQIESICRNMGSKLGAVELLEGESRQRFQTDISEAFRIVLEDKSVTLLEGVVRHIYIPQEIRLPIQNAYIADEKKLALVQKQITTRTEAELEEARSKVELETERVRVGTEKLVAKLIAEGHKTAEETKAETIKLVAAIAKQTAEIDAQSNVLLGEAEALAKQMAEEAKADKFRLAVEAFSTAEAFNQWVFANGLPDDVQLDLLYAGDGTFWTDLKGFSETLLGRQAKQSMR